MLNGQDPESPMEKSYMPVSAFRPTPFHDGTSTANLTTWWYAWNGYVVPDVYTDLHSEIGAIRNAVSMNEMSPIPKMKISGPDSQRFVNGSELINYRQLQPCQSGRGVYTY